MRTASYAVIPPKETAKMLSEIQAFAAKLGKPRNSLWPSKAEDDKDLQPVIEEVKQTEEMLELVRDDLSA